MAGLGVGQPLIKGMDRRGRAWGQVIGVVALEETGS